MTEEEQVEQERLFEEHWDKLVFKNFVVPKEYAKIIWLASYEANKPKLVSVDGDTERCPTCNSERFERLAVGAIRCFRCGMNSFVVKLKKKKSKL